MFARKHRKVFFIRRKYLPFSIETQQSFFTKWENSIIRSIEFSSRGRYIAFTRKNFSLTRKKYSFRRGIFCKIGNSFTITTKKVSRGSPLYHYQSIGLIKQRLRLCCSVRKYSHCACTLPFSSNSGLLSAYS